MKLTTGQKLWISLPRRNEAHEVLAVVMKERPLVVRISTVSQGSKIANQNEGTEVDLFLDRALNSKHRTAKIKRFITRDIWELEFVGTLDGRQRFLIKESLPVVVQLESVPNQNFVKQVPEKATLNLASISGKEVKFWSPHPYSPHTCLNCVLTVDQQLIPFGVKVRRCSLEAPKGEEIFGIACNISRINQEHWDELLLWLTKSAKVISMTR